MPFTDYVREINESIAAKDSSATFLMAKEDFVRDLDSTSIGNTNFVWISNWN